MILNNIQLCRAAAFLDLLKAAANHPKAAILTDREFCGKLNETPFGKALTSLQENTIALSSRYAEAYDVDFPDETLPESLLATLARGKGRPSLEEMERLTVLAPSYPRMIPAIEVQSEAVAIEQWASELEPIAEREAYKVAA